MIAYIDMYKDRFGVEPICRTLGATEGGFITSRGYRAAKTRPISDREVRDRQLIPVMCEVHAGSAEVLVESGVYAARATASIIMVSNSTGVSFPSRRCLRFR